MRQTGCRRMARSTLPVWEPSAGRPVTAHRHDDNQLSFPEICSRLCFPEIAHRGWKNGIVRDPEAAKLKNPGDRLTAMWSGCLPASKGARTAGSVGIGHSRHQREWQYLVEYRRWQKPDRGQTRHPQPVRQISASKRNRHSRVRPHWLVERARLAVTDCELLALFPRIAVP